MQHIISIHVPSLILNSVPSGYLACQTITIIKAEPVPFPTPNYNWSYFIGTVDQYIQPPIESLHWSKLKPIQNNTEFPYIYGRVSNSYSAGVDRSPKG